MEGKKNYFWVIGILLFVLGLIVCFSFFNKKLRLKIGVLTDIPEDLKSITLPTKRHRIVLYDSNDKILKYYSATKDNDVYRISNEDPEIKKYLIDVI